MFELSHDLKLKYESLLKMSDHKNKMLFGSIAKKILPGLVLASMSFPTSALAQVTNITDVSLAGYVGYLTEETKRGLISKLNLSSSTSAASLSTSIKAAQEWLDTVTPNTYSLSMVEVDEGSYEIIINLKLGMISGDVEAAEGYSAALVSKSVPELKSGKILSKDTEWLSETAVSQANSHPLKRTNVIWNLSQDKPVEAVVSATAPYGKEVFVSSINNYGSPASGRYAGSISYLNGNLTGTDDQLSISSNFALKHPKDVHSIGINYVRPDYANNQAFEIGGVYANGSLQGVPSAAGLLDTDGDTKLINLAWHKYLPSLGFGLQSSPKFSLRLTNAIYSSSVESQKFSANLSSYSVRSNSVTLGFSDKIIVSDDTSVSFNVNLEGGGPGLLGSSSAESWKKANSSAGKYVTADYSIAVNTKVQGFSLSTAFSGQQSNGSLLPNKQVSLGSHSYVRGFESVSTQVLGDDVQVLQFDAVTPALFNEAITNITGDSGSTLKIKGHLDIGRASLGSDSASHLASAGVGVNLYSGKTGISIDVDSSWRLRAPVGITTGKKPHITFSMSKIF